ncbi:hypothetical protein [Prochlorococcus marinus]|uniref:hypothetical protein n=1 Tax=Prochlorococcus marinus TaxID=1219 RepID=UPI0022B3A6BB|nr:hypothetical protein [Prochlorococcus marinus]
MSDNKFENFRLSLMQDLLPVGFAILDRAKEGGAGKVIEVFRSSDFPIKNLQVEGSESARLFREKLDQISPGLGNPVQEVKITVEPQEKDVLEDKSLIDLLNRIEHRIDLINTYLERRKLDN